MYTYIYNIIISIYIYMFAIHLTKKHHYSKSKKKTQNNTKHTLLILSIDPNSPRTPRWQIPPPRNQTSSSHHLLGISHCALHHVLAPTRHQPDGKGMTTPNPRSFDSKPGGFKGLTPFNIYKTFKGFFWRFPDNFREPKKNKCYKSFGVSFHVLHCRNAESESSKGVCIKPCFLTNHLGAFNTTHSVFKNPLITGHFITNPKNALLQLQGKSLKITKRVYCLIPPKWVPFNDPCWLIWPF